MNEMISIFKIINGIESQEPTKVFAAMQDPHGALFVDVREQSEWDSGHVEGMRHIPLAELSEHLEELLRAPTLYFICRSGGRSTRAAKFLKEHGHKNAINIASGILGWRNAGFPIS